MHGSAPREGGVGGRRAVLAETEVRPRQGVVQQAADRFGVSPDDGDSVRIPEMTSVLMARRALEEAAVRA